MLACWRTTGDLLSCWDCKTDWGGIGVIAILDKQIGLESFAGPGGWNDPDMLQVGNGSLTLEESRSHFNLWCVLAAPLSLDIRGEYFTGPDEGSLDNFLLKARE